MKLELTNIVILGADICRPGGRFALTGYIGGRTLVSAQPS